MGNNEMRDVAELLLATAPPRMDQIDDEGSSEEGRDDPYCRVKTGATVTDGAVYLLVLACSTDETKAEGNGIIWAPVPSLGAAATIVVL